MYLEFADLEILRRSVESCSELIWESPKDVDVCYPGSAVDLGAPCGLAPLPWLVDLVRSDPALFDRVGLSYPRFAFRARGGCAYAAVWPGQDFGLWLVGWDPSLRPCPMLSAAGQEVYRVYLRTLIKERAGLDTSLHLIGACRHGDFPETRAFLHVLPPADRPAAGPARPWAVLDLTETAPPFGVRCRRVRPGGEPRPPRPSVTRLKGILRKEPTIEVTERQEA